MALLWWITRIWPDGSSHSKVLQQHPLVSNSALGKHRPVENRHLASAPMRRGDAGLLAHPATNSCISSAAAANSSMNSCTTTRLDFTLSTKPTHCPTQYVASSY